MPADVVIDPEELKFWFTLIAPKVVAARTTPATTRAIKVAFENLGFTFVLLGRLLPWVGVNSFFVALETIGFVITYPNIQDTKSEVLINIINRKN